jgi:hypothetical protein
MSGEYRVTRSVKLDLNNDKSNAALEHLPQNPDYTADNTVDATPMHLRMAL